jgi:hypothetical protein
MSQKIEAPTPADVDRIARQLIHASTILDAALHASLDGSRKDLGLIQRILDSKTIEPEAEYTLRALGMAFGRVFINITPATIGGWSRTSLVAIPRSDSRTRGCWLSPRR